MTVKPHQAQVPVRRPFHADVQSETVVVIDDELDLVDSTIFLLLSYGRRAIGSMDGSQAVPPVTGEDAERNAGRRDQAREHSSVEAIGCPNRLFAAYHEWR